MLGTLLPTCHTLIPTSCVSHSLFGLFPNLVLGLRLAFPEHFINSISITLVINLIWRDQRLLTACSVICAPAMMYRDLVLLK